MMALRARARLAVLDGNRDGTAADDFAAAIGLGEEMGLLPSVADMRRDVARSINQRADADTQS
jgi:hypothetical protein